MNLRITSNAVRVKNTISNQKKEYKLNLRQFEKAPVLHEEIIADKKEDIISKELEDKDISNDIVQQFEIGDHIQNTDGLTGIIASKNNNLYIVDWNDNTKERIKFAMADGYISKYEVKEEEQKPNIEEIKEQYQEKKEKAMATNKKVQTIKMNSAQQVISLAVDKGMIDQDDAELELMKLSSMDDAAFAEYEENVINFTTDGHEVYSEKPAEVDEDFTGLTEEQIEAKKKLNELKKSGIITSSSLSNTYMASTEKRSLKDLDSRPFDINSRPETLEDAFVKLMDDFENQQVKSTTKVAGITRHAEPHQGLQQPLIMGSANNDNSLTNGFSNSLTSNLSRLLQNMDWTTPGNKINVRG